MMIKVNLRDEVATSIRGIENEEVKSLVWKMFGMDGEDDVACVDLLDDWQKLKNEVFEWIRSVNKQDGWTNSVKEFVENCSPDDRGVIDLFEVYNEGKMPDYFPGVRFVKHIFASSYLNEFDCDNDIAFLSSDTCGLLIKTISSRDFKKFVFDMSEDLSAIMHRKITKKQVAKVLEAYLVKLGWMKYWEEISSYLFDGLISFDEQDVLVSVIGDSGNIKNVENAKLQKVIYSSAVPLSAHTVLARVKEEGYDISSILWSSKRYCPGVVEFPKGYIGSLFHLGLDRRGWVELVHLVHEMLRDASGGVTSKEILERLSFPEGFHHNSFMMVMRSIPYVKLSTKSRWVLEYSGENPDWVDDFALSSRGMESVFDEYGIHDDASFERSLSILPNGIARRAFKARIRAAMENSKADGYEALAKVLPDAVLGAMPDKRMFGEDIVERAQDWGIGTIGEVLEAKHYGLLPSSGQMKGSQFKAAEKAALKLVDLSDTAPMKNWRNSENTNLVPFLELLRRDLNEFGASKRLFDELLKVPVGQTAFIRKNKNYEGPGERKALSREMMEFSNWVHEERKWPSKFKSMLVSELILGEGFIKVRAFHERSELFSGFSGSRSLLVFAHWFADIDLDISRGAGFEEYVSIFKDKNWRNAEKSFLKRVQDLVEDGNIVRKSDVNKIALDELKNNNVSEAFVKLLSDYNRKDFVYSESEGSNPRLFMCRTNFASKLVKILEMSERPLSREDAIKAYMEDSQNSRIPSKTSIVAGFVDPRIYKFEGERFGTVKHQLAGWEVEGGQRATTEICEEEVSMVVAEEPDRENLTYKALVGAGFQETMSPDGRLVLFRSVDEKKSPWFAGRKRSLIVDNGLTIAPGLNFGVEGACINVSMLLSSGDGFDVELRPVRKFRGDKVSDFLAMVDVLSRAKDDQTAFRARITIDVVVNEKGLDNVEALMKQWQVPASNDSQFVEVSREIDYIG